MDSAEIGNVSSAFCIYITLQSKISLLETKHWYCNTIDPLMQLLPKLLIKELK